MRASLPRPTLTLLLCNASCVPSSVSSSTAHRQLLSLLQIVGRPLPPPPPKRRGEGHMAWQQQPRPRLFSHKRQTTAATAAIQVGGVAVQRRCSGATPRLQQLPVHCYRPRRPRAERHSHHQRNPALHRRRRHQHRHHPHRWDSIDEGRASSRCPQPQPSRWRHSRAVRRLTVTQVRALWTQGPLCTRTRVEI